MDLIKRSNKQDDPRMEKLHFKRHELIFCLVGSMVIVLQARQKTKLEQNPIVYHINMVNGLQKHSEKFQIRSLRWKWCIRICPGQKSSNGFTARYADFSQKECV